MADAYKVFLSAVSTEFRGARAAVASDLRARGLTVRVQEDFQQGDDTTLRKLHDYIKSCDAVVSIIGTRSGAKPPANAAAPFAHILPPSFTQASLTQWEVHFARYYRRRLLRFHAHTDWHAPEAAPADDDPSLQASFVTFLTETEGLDRNYFSSIAELRAEVLRQDWPRAQTAKPIHPRFVPLGTLFKGREDKMKELSASLASPGVTAITNKAHAMHGLGGIGKTRLALEYGLAHQANYSALLFVSGETPAKLDTDLAALAALLNLPEQAATEDAVKIHAVLEWLHTNRAWYLLIDNVDMPEALRAVENKLAQLSQGHTIITSRLGHFSPFFAPLHLDVLATDAAADLLLESTQGGRHKQPDDAAQAKSIATDLDGLALALVQAAAYIQVRHITLAAYRAAWAIGNAALLDWHDPLTMADYPRAAAATWRTSVAALTDSGRALLHRLAFLAPDPVPDFLLDVGVPGVPAIDPAAALADLARYSLVTRHETEHTFTMHRVVQAVTRDSLNDAAKTRALTEALGWINAAFLGDAQDTRAWPRLDPLAPHAISVATFGDVAGITEPVARLMGDASLLLDAKARYSEAESLVRHAVAIDLATYGPEHPNVAIRLNNLATLLHATNRQDEAETLIRQALAIDEACYGPIHPEVATRLNNLAQVLQATTRMVEAETLTRRALAIDDASYGPDHPNVARDVSNLARLLQDTNRLVEAEPMMRRALDIDEAKFGPSHPTVAIRLNNLATLFQDTNRLVEAEPIMRRALAIDKAHYGPEHPIVAVRLHNLASLLRATNRLDAAEPLMRRALAITEASLFPGHPDVAIRLSSLANLLQATNRSDEAEPLMRRALAISEASYGHDHPAAAPPLNNLAHLLQATNRFSEAEPLMRRVLTIVVAFTITTARAHPHLMDAAESYRRLLVAMGHDAAAATREVRAVLAPALPFLRPGTA